MEPLDESDAALVSKLKGELIGGTIPTHFKEDDAQASEGSAQDVPEASKDEDAFLEAMNALRKAKHEGSGEGIASAERRLQDVVRAEMLSREACRP